MKTIKEVEIKTERLINELVEFYKTNDRFPGRSNGEEELAEFACHVRHCWNSNYGYPSLMDRYPEQCEIILKKEKEIIVKKRVWELKEFFLKSLNQPPKMIKKEINYYAFWMWTKNHKDYLDEIKIPFNFTEILEELEPSIEFLQIPSRNSMKDVFEKDKKLSVDHTRVEEFITKVKTYYKAKDDLVKRYERFMDNMSDQNYKEDLALESAMGELIDAFSAMIEYTKRVVRTEEIDGVGGKQEITMMDIFMNENSYIKEVRDNEKTRKIEFIGTYVPSEKDLIEKPKKKRKKKIEEDEE